MVYDLLQYVCPPNGNQYRLFGLGDESCQCIQAADGWIEFRKNHNVEEFYATASVIGRGADTSNISPNGADINGTFYVQYTKDAQGTLTYGAAWVKRMMEVGETFHRTPHVIIYKADGSIQQEYDNPTDITLVAQHPTLMLPQSPIPLQDVLEFQWGGEEVYYYARNYGLVGWKNLQGGQTSYIGALNATMLSPFPHAHPRSPVAIPPVISLTDSLEGISTMSNNPDLTIQETPFAASGTINDTNVQYRTEPSTRSDSTIAGQLANGDPVQVISKATTNGTPSTWYKFQRADVAYWVAAQFVSVSANVPVDNGSHPAPNPITPLNFMGIINDTNVSYRTAPWVSNDTLVGHLGQAQPVKVIAKQTVSGNPADWYEVDMDGGPYWIAAQYISPVTEHGPTIFQVGQNVRLNVPWFTQLEGGTGHNACGETAVKMLLAYYGKPTPSLHNMADHIRKWGNDTTSSDLQTLAQFYGQIDLTIKHLNGSLDDLRAILDSKKPVIILVSYHEMQFHNSIEDGKVGHWPIVTGYDSSGFYLNDPLWLPQNRQGQGGKDIPISADTLTKAMQAREVDMLTLF